MAEGNTTTTTNIDNSNRLIEQFVSNILNQASSVVVANGNALGLNATSNDPTTTTTTTTSNIMSSMTTMEHDLQPQQQEHHHQQAQTTTTTTTTTVPSALGSSNNDTIDQDDDDDVDVVKEQQDDEIIKQTLSTTTTTTTNSTMSNNHCTNDNNVNTMATKDCKPPPLFLTIDHKLALRRRNTSSISAFELDTPSPSIIQNDNIAPFLKHATTLADGLNLNNNNLLLNNNNNNYQQVSGDPPVGVSMKNFNHHHTPNIELMNMNDDHECLIDNDLAKYQKAMTTVLRQTLVTIFMAIFITVVHVYTWLTLPIYFLTQKPWIQRAKSNKRRVKIFDQSSIINNNNQLDQQVSSSMNGQQQQQKNNVNNEKIELQQQQQQCSMSPIYVRDDSGDYDHPIFKMDTLGEVMDALPSIHDPDRPCLGFRQVLSEEVSYDDLGKARRIDGRQLKRFRLGDYKWLSYKQVYTVTNNMAQGLMTKGVRKNSKVLIISETRIEWMLSFQAILRTNATIVTVFSNLGMDGVRHAIEETGVETAISSIECLPLLKSALKNAKHQVKTIIYFDGFSKPEMNYFINANSSNNNNNDDGTDNNNNIEFISLSSVEEAGKLLVAEDKCETYPPSNQDDLTLIMYTSGTTGAPKAAMLSHRQFYAEFKALYVLVRHLIDQAAYHTYISYLPMAHVLELTLELFFFVGGVRLGYASTFTLTDSAPGLCAGQKSDIKLLKPTVMTTVPLVLERIIKEINEKLRSRTPVSQPVFQFLIDYKSKWTRLGYRCDLVTKLLCKKVREQLGGDIQYMICGGAPLHANTQATIKSALDVILLQGYGATETTGAVLCMDFDDLEYGRVGATLGKVYFRLRDWTEGGYSVKDQPNPRGEVMVGGDIITQGYFKRPELNEEVFFTDQLGIRWFCTGDIGEMYPNGTVKIIDRCKDLIKLQNGEYISLGKVEAVLKGCQMVDNICVYGGTFSNDIVALISPNPKALNELVTKLGKTNLTTNERCNDLHIQQAVFEEVIQIAKQASLGKKEIPRRIKLVPEVWSPDNGILTAAMKLKRRIVETTYKQDLYDLYNVQKFNVITSNGFDQNNNSTTTTA